MAITGIDLIGLAYDGYAREGRQASAAAVLREAGIADIPAGMPLADVGDLFPARQSSERGPSGLLNEVGVVDVQAQLAATVRRSLAADRFPLVVGGDCAALVGAIRAVRDARGAAGLVHVDGHEDTTPIDASEDGEAANSEIGMLLGTVARGVSGSAVDGLPALDRSALALLGQRDDAWRRSLNIGTLADLGVFTRDAGEVAADPGDAARAAVEHVRRSVADWWLHIDVDALDPVEFPAQGIEGYPDEPGGLRRDELSRLVAAVVDEPGCVGASIAIYDPDQDPDRSGARDVVALAATIVGALS